MNVDSSLDPGLTKFSYETLLMLTVFATHETFTNVAEVVDRPAHAVRKQLQDLAKAVETRTGTPIMQERNSRRWELTDAGHQLATQAEGILGSMNTAMQSIEGGQAIKVVTTSNCCGYMSDLMGRVEAYSKHYSASPVRIVPLLERSSEVSLRTMPDDVEFAMFSILMPTAKSEIQRGREVELDQGSMIPLDIQTIGVMSGRPIYGPPHLQPTPNDLLESGVTFCIPTGGVAWEFVWEYSHDWHLVRYRQHFPVTDLYGGIKVLETGIAGPNAAMIVHGIDEDDPRLSGIGDVVIAPLYDDPERKRWRAVTGFFRAHRKNPASISDEIWKQALDLWNEDGR